MTKRKATIKEAQQLIMKKINEEGPPINPIQLQIIVDEIYPWSWGHFCHMKKIQTKIRVSPLKDERYD